VQKDVQYPFINTYPSNIMYQLVYDNIGTGAGIRRALNFSESLPISNYGYSINAITGNTDGIYFFFMNLYDAIKQLSDLTLNPIDIDKPALPIYFDVVAVSPSSFVFTQYPQQRGSDRRFRVGIANATILSDAKGQLRDVRFVADWKEEKTVIIPVAQNNTNGNNTVSFEYVTDFRRIQNSPYSRREVIANTTIGNFSGEGKKELKNPANFPTFSAYATLQDAPGFMYGVDWNYGDFFTINIFGTVVDSRINAITISVTNKSEQFDVSLQVNEEISF
jgi:hypothetical protein